MTETLTRPERAQAFAEARRIVRDGIRERGGCAFCTRRDRTFGIGRIATCGLHPQKQFPRCVGQPGGFEFDEISAHD